MAKKAAKTTLQPVNFEASLAELEQLVEQMEVGDITLEDSLKHFERGITLTRQCQQALKQAEQKVQILLKGHDEPTAFNSTDNDSPPND